MKRAIVLSGGGARGAYEAGALRYIMEEMPDALGHAPRFDIICGTSVGAINSAWLAATLDEPKQSVQRMWYLWRTLKFDEVVRPSWREIWRLARNILAGSPVADDVDAQRHNDGRRGGLLDTAFFNELVREEIPFSNISRNLADGLFETLTVSTTDILSGRTTIFAHTAGHELPPWTRDPRRVAVSGPMTPSKVLASAAIPVLFPPVRIGQRWFSDGGLRQNTPMAPALRLGADRVLVLTLHNRHESASIAPNPFQKPEAGRDKKGPYQTYPSYAFMAGKLLDALLLDPLDYDLTVLERINSILKEGEAAFSGEGSFVDHLNEIVREHRGQEYRIVEPMLLRPSEDLGRMASELATSVSDDFWGSKPMGLLCQSAAEQDGYYESDLLSYLLFDYRYTGQLLELGYHDAAEQHDALVAFFSD